MNFKTVSLNSLKSIFAKHNKKIREHYSTYCANKTVYVSPDGSDETGDGSDQNPFKTIQKAINEIPNECYNCTVYLKDGTYNCTSESIKIHHKRSIVITCRTRHSAILDMSTYTGFDIVNSNVTILHLKIQFGWVTTNIDNQWNTSPVRINYFSSVWIYETTIILQSAGSLFNCRGRLTCNWHCRFGFTYEKQQDKTWGRQTLVLTEEGAVVELSANSALYTSTDDEKYVKPTRFFDSYGGIIMANPNLCDSPSFTDGRGYIKQINGI